MKKLISMLAGLSLVLTAMAQPGGSGPKHEGNRPMKKQLTVEQEAQMKVDQMASELDLTDKQLKKLTKFYKKDIKYRREHFAMQGPGSGGPGEGPDGGPMNNESKNDNIKGQRPPQGATGQGFGGPGNVGPGFGGPGSGGPGQGGPGHGPGMGPRPQQEEPFDYEKLEKYNAKQDKKLKKIIGEENFAQWSSSHPHEYPNSPKWISCKS